MFRGRSDGIRLAKDNTVRIPLSFSKFIGLEKIGIYGSALDSSLSLIPLSRLDGIDSRLLGMCFGHYALNKKNRLYLPEQAQQYAGIEKIRKITIVGLIDYMEVWSEDEYRKIIAEGFVCEVIEEVPLSRDELRQLRKDVGLAEEEENDGHGL